MAVYTHLSDGEITQLTGAYGFDDLSCMKGIAQGVENSNFLIEGVHEGTRKKAILTVFEKRVQPEELPFFMRLMQHLAGRGIACPLPFANAQGQALSHVRGKPVCLVSFVQGSSVEAPDASHCRQLGAAMAQMHLAGGEVACSRANDLSLQGWRALDALIHARLDDISAGLGEVIAQELVHLQAHWPCGLPRGIIHGDLFPDNVFFDAQGNVSGIIDFYFACEDDFAYELAICLNCWCFDASGTQLDEAKAEALIAGYESVRPLEAPERAALPLLRRGAALRFLLTRAHDVLFHDEEAMVSPHDPLPYVRRLEYWRSTKEI